VAAISSEIRNELKSVETEIKYEVTCCNRQRAMERMKKSEQRSIPGWFDYHSVSGLSREIRKSSRTCSRAPWLSLTHSGSDAGSGVLVNVLLRFRARRREQAAAI